MREEQNIFWYVIDRYFYAETNLNPKGVRQTPTLPYELVLIN